MNVNNESVDGEEPEGVDGVHDQLVAPSQREGEAASGQLPCLYIGFVKLVLVPQN